MSSRIGVFSLYNFVWIWKRISWTMFGLVHKASLLFSVFTSRLKFGWQIFVVWFYLAAIECMDVCDWWITWRDVTENDFYDRLDILSHNLTFFEILLPLKVMQQSQVKLISKIIFYFVISSRNYLKLTTFLFVINCSLKTSQKIIIKKLW